MAEFFRTGAQQKEKAEEGKTAAAPVSDFELRIAGVARTLKLLEERYDTIRQQIRFIDYNLLESKKKLEKELKVVDIEVGELNREIIKLRENVDGFSKELGMAAKAEDLKALSKYLELWEPVEFLTRKQAESMIKEAKRKL